MSGLLEHPPADPRTLVIYDLEASLEHMARGTPRATDLMLAVTEPYFRSLETTVRLARLAASLGIRPFHVVANKVRSAREQIVLEDFCRSHGLSLLGTVPLDGAVTEADGMGRALLDVAPRSPAAASMAALADRMLEEVH